MVSSGARMGRRTPTRLGPASPYGVAGPKGWVVGSAAGLSGDPDLVRGVVERALGVGDELGALRAGTLHATRTRAQLPLRVTFSDEYAGYTPESRPLPPAGPRTQRARLGCGSCLRSSAWLRRPLRCNDRSRSAALGWVRRGRRCRLEGPTRWLDIGSTEQLRRSLTTVGQLLVPRPHTLSDRALVERPTQTPHGRLHMCRYLKRGPTSGEVDIDGRRIPAVGRPHSVARVPLRLNALLQRDVCARRHHGQHRVNRLESSMPRIRVPDRPRSPAASGQCHGRCDHGGRRHTVHQTTLEPPHGGNDHTFCWKFHLRCHRGDHADSESAGSAFPASNPGAATLGSIGPCPASLD